MIDVRHLGWIPVGALVGFGVPFVCDDVLTLPLDLYYLVYFGVALGFLGFYARTTDLFLPPHRGR